jgi:carbonic anhydrase
MDRLLDSRVPANEIHWIKPGEVFVRIEILLIWSFIVDKEYVSVLDYAVTKLKVKHVLASGHYVAV